MSSKAPLTRPAVETNVVMRSDNILAMTCTTRFIIGQEDEDMVIQELKHDHDTEDMRYFVYRDDDNGVMLVVFYR